MGKWEEYNTEQLGKILMDYHEKVHGFHPGNPDIYNNRDRIIALLNELDSYLMYLKATARGRQMLRMRGWIVEEPQFS